MPKISVIIPVYNVEDYIGQCLDSVINQTFENIEIICVNDGSTDNSLEILNRYAEYDKRIIIINQENKGLSNARNVGIKLAIGKYIYFLDSDDFIDINAFEKLYYIAELDKLDFVSFNYEVVCDDNSLNDIYLHKKKRERNIMFDDIYSGFDMFEKLVLSNNYQSQVWLLFINRDFFVKTNIMFKEGILHEDNLFTFTLILSSNKVRQVSDKFYKRRVRLNSIMTNPKTFDNFFGYFTSYIDMIGYNVNELCPISTKVAIRIFLDDIFQQMLDIYNKISNEEKLKINSMSFNELYLFEKIMPLSYEKSLILKENNKHINKLEGQLKWARNQIIELKKDVKYYKLQFNILSNSRSYKIGCLLTHIPRKIKSKIVRRNDNDTHNTN